MAYIKKPKELHLPTGHRPQHEPTKPMREMVSLHCAVGTRHEVIAEILGIDAKTLRKHYRRELDFSKAQANATVGGALFNQAKSGNTAAMIFWMKTQAGWKETQAIDHTSTDGSMSPKAGIDATKLSSAALKEIIALQNDTNAG